MIVPALFFYLFAGVCVASAFMVIASKNPVHSVLYLILAFVNASGLFILLGAEFLAMILVIVYVGAVLVLFLFVVMMLDVDFAELRQGFLQYLPIGALLGITGIGGDLAESALKRAAGAKDSSSILPGHGGFLDRIDSLLFASPALYYYYRALVN